MIPACDCLLDANADMIWYVNGALCDMVSYTYTISLHIGHDTFIYKIAVCINIYIYRHKL